MVINTQNFSLDFMYPDQHHSCSGGDSVSHVYQALGTCPWWTIGTPIPTRNIQFSSCCIVPSVAACWCNWTCTFMPIVVDICEPRLKFQCLIDNFWIGGIFSQYLALHLDVPLFGLCKGHLRVSVTAPPHTSSTSRKCSPTDGPHPWCKPSSMLNTYNIIIYKTFLYLHNMLQLAS